MKNQTSKLKTCSKEKTHSQKNSWAEGIKKQQDKNDKKQIDKSLYEDSLWDEISHRLIQCQEQ